MANGLNLEAEMVIMALAVVPDKVTAIQQCPTDHTEIQQVHTSIGLPLHREPTADFTTS